MGKKLTKRLLDATPAPAKRVFLSDSELPGFVAAVSSARTITFYVRYRANGGGRRAPFRWVTLGRFGVITVDQARVAARNVLSRVAHGEDPARAHAERKAAPTVAELAPLYLADARARRKPTTAREYTRIFDKEILPAFGSRRARDLGPTDLARVHASLSGRPVMANRLMQLLGSFFSWCELHGHRPKHSNPTPDIERYPEQARERFLSGDEIARLGEALDRAERVGVPAAPNRRRKLKEGPKAKHRPKSFNEPRPSNPFHLACIRFLLLSGWRESEARTLRWDALDTERGHAILKDTKSGRSVRPLGAAVFLFLEGLPRLRESPYVFPGASPDVPVINITRTWEAVRLAAKLEGVRLHDLRHTAASIAAAGGLSLPLIGALLGHRHPGTTARYAHLADDPRRLAADRMSADVTAALAGKSTPVISLEQARR
ncbi:MAG: site-specific integrase [Gemmatimonadaceae bacterium]